MTFRPLLAADPFKGVTNYEAQQEILTNLSYPLMASPKLDGIRVLIIDGVAVTRSLKPVRNKYVQAMLGRPEFNGMDGEVVAGDVLDPMAFRSTTTAVMAEDGEVPFTYWVFDRFDIHDRQYIERFALTQYGVNELSRQILPEHFPIKVLAHDTINNLEQLLEYEEMVLSKGFEGAMLRRMSGHYKYNRSTVKDEILLKLKRGLTKNGDAEIIGFKERMQNNNEATTDELGYTERSVHKDNLVGRGDLGSFQVRDTETGYEFSIGIGLGLDDKLRAEVWNNQENYLGKIIRYEWCAYGNYDLPRFPKFVAFRDQEDMS